MAPVIANTSLSLNHPPAYRWVVLVMNILAIVLYFTSNNLLGPFSSEVMETFNINTAQFGLLGTVFILGWIVTAYFGGSFAARVGDKLTMALGILAVGVFSVIWPFVNTYQGMLAVRFLQGAGGALIMVPAIGSGAVWFPMKQRGLAQGTLLGAVSLGFAICSGVGPLLAQAGIEWRQAAVYLAGIPAFALAVVFFIVVRNFRDVYPGMASIDDLLPQPEENKSSRPAGVLDYRPPENLADAFRSARFWAAVGNLFANSWSLFGMLTFIALILNEKFGFAGNNLAIVMFLSLMSGLILTPVGGILSDQLFRARRWPILFIGFLVCLVTNLMLPVSPVGLVPVLAFLMLGCIPFINGPYWCLPAELVDPSLAGRVAGLWQAIGMFGGVLAPVIGGALVDATGNLFSVMYMVAAGAVLGIITSFVIRPH